MPWQLTAVRGLLRVLPTPLRLRLARRLFIRPVRHPEPERESAWRAKGTPCVVGGMAATRFGGVGPTVWLMHGWEGRGLQLSAFIEPFLAAGWQVVALDGPGHGRTPGLAGFVPFAHAMQQGMAQERPAAIVAHSMGGAAAIIAASRSGYDGPVACLGGPPDTAQVTPRAMDLMGIHRRHHDRFMELVRARYAAYDLSGVLEMDDRAADCRAPLAAWLAAGDDDIPVDESRRIIEAGGGAVHVVEGVTHRSIMWDAPTVDAVVAWVLRA